MLLAASQHSDDPPEKDDGHSHADEAGCHPPQICKRSTSSPAAHQQIHTKTQTPDLNPVSTSYHYINNIDAEEKTKLKIS